MIDTTFDCAKAYEVEFRQVQARVTRRVARLEEDFGASLLEGFQARIEIDDLKISEANHSTDFHDPQHPWRDPTVFNLRLSSGTKGSFADVKMQTLKAWNNKAATGQLTMEELLNFIQGHINYDQNDPLAQEIQQFEDVSQLLRRHHEWLRDKFNITVFAGGIRVLITGLNGFRGEIRITFSALTAEEDVAMCVLILRALQEALKEVTTDDWYEYDLSELKTNKIANFYLTMWDIRRVA